VRRSARRTRCIRRKVTADGSHSQMPKGGVRYLEGASTETRVPFRRMSALGHSRQLCDVRVTSAYRPIAEVLYTSRHFAFVPAGDLSLNASFDQFIGAGKERRRNVETELVDTRLVYQAAGQAEARRDLNVARFSKCSQSPSSLCSNICAGAPW